MEKEQNITRGIYPRATYKKKDFSLRQAAAHFEIDVEDQIDESGNVFKYDDVTGFDAAFQKCLRILTDIKKVTGIITPIKDYDEIQRKKFVELLDWFYNDKSLHKYLIRAASLKSGDGSRKKKIDITYDDRKEFLQRLAEKILLECPESEKHWKKEVLDAILDDLEFVQTYDAVVDEVVSQLNMLIFIHCTKQKAQFAKSYLKDIKKYRVKWDLNLEPFLFLANEYNKILLDNPGIFTQIKPRDAYSLILKSMLGKDE